MSVCCVSNTIDCHILTLPRFAPEWIDELRRDLDDEPVNQHWRAGIDGYLGAARAAGYSAGSAPFVASADADDRIVPGTFASLAKALHDNPAAPFAWAGEKLVDENLEDLPLRAHVWPDGYSPTMHVSRGTHVHGVKLYRRTVVAPLLASMRSAGQCCEFFLDLAIVKPWLRPIAAVPVHVPVVGRLWRQHDRNGGRQFGREDFDRMARTLGFSDVVELRNATLTAHGHPWPIPRGPTTERS